VLVEHARTNLGVADADHAEYGGNGTHVISLLSCSLADNTIEIEIRPGTSLRNIYGSPVVQERTTCNYGLEPAFAYVASTGGLRVAAIDSTGEVRAVEHESHPFFVATLYQPQLSSLPGRPHPIWSAFIAAVLSSSGATG